MSNPVIRHQRESALGIKGFHQELQLPNRIAEPLAKLARVSLVKWLLSRNFF